MPDRVNVPKGVSRRYKKICQQIKEQKQAPASIARSIATEIEKDIKKRGKGGALLIKLIINYTRPLVDDGNLLSQLPNQWNDVHSEIERCKELIEDGDRRFTEQAAQACHRVVINEEQGSFSENIDVEFQKEYRRAIWEAEIKDPLLIAEPEQTYNAFRPHLENVDDACIEEIENRLLNGVIEPTLDETLDADIFSDL